MSVRTGVGLGVLAAALSSGAIAAQPVSDHVVLSVADVDASAGWYSELFGFSTREVPRRGAHGPNIELTLGRAGATLTRGDPGAARGASPILKVGLLVEPSELDRIAARFDELSPESVIVGVGPLPPGPAVSGWPDRHMIVRDPDGTLVQLFSERSSAADARWILAAVSVEDLDDGVSWYRRFFGFGERARPEGGDPRALLQRGDFFLEVGEFGVPATSSARGVVRLSISRDRGECRLSLTTPEGPEFEACGPNPRPGRTSHIAPK